MTTLNHLSPQERKEARGTWVNVKHKGQCILSEVDGIDCQGLNAEVLTFIDHRPHKVIWVPIAEVSMLDSVHRAWGSNGEII